MPDTPGASHVRAEAVVTKRRREWSLAWGWGVDETALKKIIAEEIDMLLAAGRRREALLERRLQKAYDELRAKENPPPSSDYL